MIGLSEPKLPLLFLFAKQGGSKDRRSARGAEPLRTNKIKNEVFSG
jgi:hypothetical protein